MLVENLRLLLRNLPHYLTSTLKTKMKTKILFLFLSVLITLMSSCKTCGNDDDIFCTEVFVYGLSVTLKDANTGAIITEDVTISAIDGSYEETLMRIESSNSFLGAGERAGTYTLTIESPNYQNFTSESITVFADECHVIPEVLEIMLLPN